MQGIDSTSLGAFATSKSVYELRPERYSNAHESEQSPAKGHRSEEKGEFTRSRSGADRAANIFRQEFMMKIKQSFSVEVESRSGAAGNYQRSESIRDVAAGVLTAARSITEKNIGKATETIAAMRKTVGQAMTASQKFTDTDAEAAAVKETAALVNSGLDELEEKAASGSVSELSFEAKVKERSSIRIRTQEGDVVTFSLRRVDKLSFSDELTVGELNSSRTTEFSVSSRSQLSIVVKGDLNEGELEAIRAVFAAAERLADEFFAGDMDAALEIAAGLEFDSEQLARVSMGFRSEVKVSVSQSAQQIGRLDPHVELEGPNPDTDVPLVSIVPVTETVVPAAKPIVPAIEPVTPGVVDADSNTNESEVAPGSASGMQGFAAGLDSLLNFLGKLGDYLGQVAGVMETNSFDDANLSSVRFEIDQSFRLEVLRAVMSVSAPEETEPKAELSASRIQQLDVVADAGPRRLSS